VTVLDVASIPVALRAARDPALARIEDAGLSASQPREQAIYDGWLLRYANGKAKRARSINPIAAGDLPLEEKLAYCADFYDRRGVPLIFRITPFSRPAGIDDALDALEYAAAEETRVMVAALDRAIAVPAPAVPVTELERAEFGVVLAGLHGLDPVRAVVERDRYAHSVVDGLYLAVREEDRAVACGCAVFDGALVGVYGMVTAAARRGQGLATRLVGELLRRARSRGCTTAYLQVEAVNTPARRAYAKFGFTDRYAYWYRSPPGKGRT
jgi:GNAT superfamily N-acetyltransferase